MDTQQTIEIKAAIQEIKRGQDKIAAALLGDFEDNSIGLIEQTRNLKREVAELNKAREIQELQITEVVEFKRNTKKVVAGIALVIPFVFEIIKLGVSAVWEVATKQ
jgi:hypothetical protein